MKKSRDCEYTAFCNVICEFNDVCNTKSSTSRIEID